MGVEDRLWRANGVVAEGTPAQTLTGGKVLHNLSKDAGLPALSEGPCDNTACAFYPANNCFWTIFNEEAVTTDSKSCASPEEPTAGGSPHSQTDTCVHRLAAPWAMPGPATALCWHMISAF